MNVKQYKVTCLSCHESDVLTIDVKDHRVLDFARQMLTNIFAARYRGDLEWGFECKCGNDNRLARSEQADMASLAQGDPISLKRIADSLKIADAKQFKMESA